VDLSLGFSVLDVWPYFLVGRFLTRLHYRPYLVFDMAWQAITSEIDSVNVHCWRIGRTVDVSLRSDVRVRDWCGLLDVSRARDVGPLGVCGGLWTSHNLECRCLRCQQCSFQPLFGALADDR